MMKQQRHDKKNVQDRLDSRFISSSGPFLTDLRLLVPRLDYEIHSRSSEGVNPSKSFKMKALHCDLLNTQLLRLDEGFNGPDTRGHSQLDQVWGMSADEVISSLEYSGICFFGLSLPFTKFSHNTFF